MPNRRHTAAIQICFRHNFSKNYPQDLKNGLERRASRFPTICAKNQLLKLNINKVTAIRVTQITPLGAPPLYVSCIARTSMCLPTKFITKFSIY